METNTPTAVPTAELARASEAGAAIPEQIAGLPDLRSQEAQSLLQTDNMEADKRPGRVVRAGHYIKDLFVREGVGAVIDGVTLSMGLPAPAVAGIGSGVDVISRRVQKRSHENDQDSSETRSRSRNLGHFAVMMAASILSYKIAPGVAEHLSNSFGHGFGGDFSAVIGNNAAAAGVESVFKRL